MNSKIKSIVLVDQHLDMNSDRFERMDFLKSDFAFLDPVNLFSELDWTCYEDDVRVINKIYSRLSEEGVMNNKNEQFYEIATLKSDQKTIILFKLVQDGTIRYSYVFDSDFLELVPSQAEYSDRDDHQFQSFESFNEMLENLLKENDLSLFESRFVDGSLEKAYFRVLSREFKTKNLIEIWLMAYSVN